MKPIPITDAELGELHRLYQAKKKKKKSTKPKRVKI